MTDKRVHKAFLLLLLVAISAAFVAMIRGFLLTILLAAMFAGVIYPLYTRVLRLLRGRTIVASLATILLLLIVVIVPLLTIAGIVANEALQVSQNVGPRIQVFLEDPRGLDVYLRTLPGYSRVEPYQDQVVTKAAEIVGSTGTFLFRTISAGTRGTVLFFFHFFVLLYTMFFFLIDGPRLLRTVLEYLPLSEAEERRMLERFMSVTRATMKGTLLIGAIQGTLGGLAFWVVGIDGAVFWGTLMIVLSIIPGVGGALVWVPAVVVLMVTGQFWWGLGLGAFCGLVVGSVDNLLRPRLVGRDTQMHELLIFFSTLGGIVLFGATGFIIGPILAALFMTTWEMFGVAYGYLPAAPIVDGGDAPNDSGV